MKKITKASLASLAALVLAALITSAGSGGTTSVEKGILSKIAKSEAAYFIENGTYWQGLENRSAKPLGQKKSMAQLVNLPSVSTDSPRVRVDRYKTPRGGQGFQVIFTYPDGMVKSYGYGPESKDRTNKFVPPEPKTATSTPKAKSSFNFTDLFKPIIAYALGSHSVDLENSSSQSLTIAAASQTGLEPNSDFTIEAWIRPESTPANALTSIFNGGDNLVGPEKGYFLRLRSTGKIQVGFGNSTGDTQSVFTTTNAVIANMDATTCYHVAAACTIATPLCAIYINAASVSVDTISTSATTIGYDTTRLGIGDNGNGDANRFFDGLIDDVRFWDDVRTAGEISANYNAELVGNEANLQGYWKLNNSPNDSTANANNLTENNAPAYSATSCAAAAAAASSIPEANVILFQ